jgi:molybdate transport system ATP-binding protein
MDEFESLSPTRWECPYHVVSCSPTRLIATQVTLQCHSDATLLSIMPVTLVSLAESASGQILLLLDASVAPLLARIAHRSVEQLGLRPGMSLWAQIKAVALMI